MADKEKLSALMDGDFVDDALIKELEQNLESQDTWKNYHLIGDIMRGEAPETVNWDIANSVATALAAEPEHSQVIAPLMEPQPVPEVARRQLPAWLTQLGQVGVAACVSLAVILGVQQYGGSDTNNIATEQLPVLQTVPLVGNVQPVSLTRDNVVAQQSTEAQRVEQRRRINAMLQDYELQLRLTSDSKMEDEAETELVVE